MSLFFNLFNFNDFYEDRSRWILWMPVLLGIGIGIYFGLPEEPPLWWGLITLIFVGLAYVLRGSLLKLIPLAFVFIWLGFSVANLRTHLLDTRMLNYPLPPPRFGLKAQWKVGNKRLPKQENLHKDLSWPIFTPLNLRSFHKKHG